MSEATPITFEAGYRRLQEIAEQVNQTEVPVDRMGDLFAEGKGLDRALTDHLAEQKARIERIERGEEIQAFRIASPSDDAVEASDADFSISPSSAPATPASDDDIPF
jgi:exodeoxyribonuclease VII small subunit